MTHNIFWHFFFTLCSLCGKDTGTSSGLDLLLSKLGKVLSLDNDRNIDLSVSKKLEVSLGDEVNDGGLSSSILGGLVNSLSSNVENLVNIHGGAEVTVLKNVELTHTNLSEVTRVIFIHHNAVVVLTSSITTSTGVTTVLSNTSVSGRDVSALLTVLAKTGWHPL